MIWTTEKINHLSIDIENGKSLKSILRDISIDVLLDSNSKSPIFPFHLPHKGKIDVSMRSNNVPFELTDSEIEKYNLFYQSPIDLYEIARESWPIREGSPTHTSMHEKLWISNYYKNRFNLIISPSISETFKLSFFCAFHYLLFNYNKSVIIFNDFDQEDGYLRSISYIDYFINRYYKGIPFYLKPGISSTTSNNILFDNNSRIDVMEYDKSKIYDADFILIPDLDRIDNGGSIALNFVPMLAKSETRMMVCTKKNILYNSDSFSIFEKLNVLDYLREENLDKLI